MVHGVALGRFFVCALAGTTIHHHSVESPHWPWGISTHHLFFMAMHQKYQQIFIGKKKSNIIF